MIMNEIVFSTTLVSINKCWYLLVAFNYDNTKNCSEKFGNCFEVLGNRNKTDIRFCPPIIVSSLFTHAWVEYGYQYKYKTHHVSWLNHFAILFNLHKIVRFSARSHKKYLINYPFLLQINYSVSNAQWWI